MAVQSEDPIMTALFVCIALHLVVVQFVLPAAGVLVGSLLAKKKDKRWWWLAAVSAAVLLFFTVRLLCNLFG